MRTRSPYEAIIAFVESGLIEPVISFDGTVYHVRSKYCQSDKDSFQILSKTEFQTWDNAHCFIHAGEVVQPYLQEAAAWLEENSNEWLRHAKIQNQHN